jgi:transposase-like protein
MSTWTDELKAQAVQMYEDAEPTAENTMDIVGEIAAELEQSPNGVRMILSKAGVYIAKTPAKAKASSGGGGGKRTSKQEALESLRTAITDAGEEPDEEIVGKLTGKAAAYFAGLLAK